MSASSFTDSTAGFGDASGRIATALALCGLERIALSAVIRRVRTGQLDSVNPVPCVSVSLCESCMRENRTCSLSGGRWLARKRATSDPTLMMPPKETRCAEGRGRPEGEPRENARVRTQSRVTLPSNLARVNEAARRDKSTRFTALLHHVDVQALERAFRRLCETPLPESMGRRRRAMRSSLRKICNDFTRKFTLAAIVAQPVRRVYIPKPDGGRRPLE